MTIISSFLLAGDVYDMSGQRIEINEVSAQVLLESVLSVDLDKYQWTEPCTDYAFDPSRVDALDAQRCVFLWMSGNSQSKAPFQ